MIVCYLRWYASKFCEREGNVLERLVEDDARADTS